VRLCPVVRAITYRTVLNNTPTTVPTMYMTQAERLRWVFVEVNKKESPGRAGASSFLTEGETV